MKASIAIITARGGSKRIPRKNIREFCGRPIIAYSIEAAIASQLFSEVIVSTDDLEIAEISLKYGATVPFMRTAQTSDDFATTAEVLIEVLNSYERKNGNLPAFACCIYPTAPMIEVTQLSKAMKILQKNEHTLSVLPVVKYGFPIQRAFRVTGDNLSYFSPEFIKCRSQDLESAYHDAGVFYCFNVREFQQKNVLIDETSRAVFLSELDVQDIDNESDWEIAELKWKLKNSK